MTIIKTQIATAAFVATLAMAQTASAQSSLDDIPIWSLLIELHTCDISNGDTDDPISIRFGTNEIELNVGRNDRERGDVDAYELVGFFPSGLTGSQLTDSPVITKRGTDMWCVDEIRFYVNQFRSPVYERLVRTRLDGDDGLSPSLVLPSLRNGGASTFSRWRDPAHNAVISQPPTLLDDDFFWILFDTLQGHLNRFEPTGRDDFRWGGLDGTSYVTVGSDGWRTYAVDYDLEYFVPNRAVNWRQADTDTSLTLTCNADGSFAVSMAAATCDVNDGVVDQADSNCRSRFGMMAEVHRAHLQRALAAVRALGRTCNASTRFNSSGDLQLP